MGGMRASFSFYTASTYNSYRKKQSLSQNGGFFFFYTAHICNSNQEGRLLPIMGASFICLYSSYMQVTSNRQTPSQNVGLLYFCIQLLYTSHIQKADPNSEWGPPALFYTAPIYNSYRKTQSISMIYVLPFGLMIGSGGGVVSVAVVVVVGGGVCVGWEPGMGSDNTLRVRSHYHPTGTPPWTLSEYAAVLDRTLQISNFLSNDIWIFRLIFITLSFCLLSWQLDSQPRCGGSSTALVCTLVGWPWRRVRPTPSCGRLHRVQVRRGASRHSTAQCLWQSRRAQPWRRVRPTPSCGRLHRVQVRRGASRLWRYRPQCNIRYPG